MKTLPLLTNARRGKAAVLRWLCALPPDSLDRLRRINESTHSSGHVILALTFGLCDANIGKLNAVITALLIARLKAERSGKQALVARINLFMNDMHEAIDQATGTNGSEPKGESPCNRPPGHRASHPLKPNLARR